MNLSRPKRLVASFGLAVALAAGGAAPASAAESNYHAVAISEIAITNTVVEPETVFPTSRGAADPLFYTATTGVLLVSYGWDGTIRTQHSLPSHSLHPHTRPITWVIEDASDTGAVIDGTTIFFDVPFGSIVISALVYHEVLETFAFQIFPRDLYVARNHPFALPTEIGGIPLYWEDSRWSNHSYYNGAITLPGSSSELRLTVPSDTFNNHRENISFQSQTIDVEQVPSSLEVGSLVALPEGVSAWTSIRWRVANPGNTGAFITDDGQLGALNPGTFTINAYVQTGRNLPIPFQVEAIAAPVEVIGGPSAESSVLAIQTNLPAGTWVSLEINPVLWAEVQTDGIVEFDLTDVYFADGSPVLAADTTFVTTLTAVIQYGSSVPLEVNGSTWVQVTVIEIAEVPPTFVPPSIPENLAPMPMPTLPTLPPVDIYPDYDGDIAEKYPAWDSNTVFNNGDRVIHDGRVFQAQWWTRGDVPGASPWGSWMEIATTVPVEADTPVFDIWTADRVFTGGETVYYDGYLWYAQWWTRNQRPGESQWGPWRQLPS